MIRNNRDYRHRYPADAATSSPRSSRTSHPGSYTAILKGLANGTGAGLVEIYDLTMGVGTSKLANISTRAVVSTGNDVVIGGFILGGGTTSDLLVIRGIGPTWPTSSQAKWC